MSTLDAVVNLQNFVGALVKSGISGNDSYGEWARKNKELMESLFWYKQLDGMPPIYSLVKPFFHPTLPLVGVNYTSTAHNTLFEFGEGWTLPIRLCRGIIFDNRGALVAKPFPKFFNYGEHAETRVFPPGPFSVTAKMDGHLGIIFEYDGKILLTTRGSFISPTAKLGQKMLDGYVKRYNWREKYKPLSYVTLLVEIIHPQTRVYLDYPEEQLVLIGAYNRTDLHDFHYYNLGLFGLELGLPVAELWAGHTLEDLVALMDDRAVLTREGFVIRFKDGLRIKIKFKSYIGRMVADKLSHTYLMNRHMSGNLERMLETLPEEIYGTALRMLGEIMLAMSTPGDAKEKWRQLYKLLPLGKSTPYSQGICRNFVKTLSG
jgi:hypothetical protein